MASHSRQSQNQPRRFADMLIPDAVAASRAASSRACARPSTPTDFIIARPRVTEADNLRRFHQPARACVFRTADINAQKILHLGAPHPFFEVFVSDDVYALSSLMKRLISGFMKMWIVCHAAGPIGTEGAQFGRVHGGVEDEMGDAQQAGWTACVWRFPVVLPAGGGASSTGRRAGVCRCDSIWSRMGASMVSVSSVAPRSFDAHSS